jgi:AcrR family transcriptional regulator
MRLTATKRRNQLLKTATDTFAEKGYDATSMEDIAEAAGVTKPLLYQHFDSKRSLYLEILDEVSAGLVGQVTAAVVTTSNPRDQVEQGIRSFFNYVATHYKAFKVLFGRSAAHDPELSKRLTEVQNTMVEAIVPLIEIDLEEPHRRLLAFSIIGMAESAARFLMTDNDFRIDSHGIEVAAKRVSQLIWTGLRGLDGQSKASNGLN